MSTFIEIVLITVGVAVAIGYGLYKLIRVKGKAIFPDEYGRKWLAWAVFFATVTALPKFFRLLDVNSFAVWLLAIVSFGGIAYVLGLIIGRLIRYGEKPNVANSELIRKVSEFFNAPQLPDKNKMTNERDFYTPEYRHAQKILPDEALYEMAWKETELNKGDRGLWAKAYAICDGEKEKTRAYYIRERVKFLQEIQKKRLDKYKEINDTDETIRILRAYRKEGSVDKCKREARRVLRNMGVKVRYIIQNEKNITPLMLAVGEGDKNKVELLLLAGVDPVEKTTYGETAYNKARKLKYGDIAQLINDYS